MTNIHKLLGVFLVLSAMAAVASATAQGENDHKTVRWTKNINGTMIYGKADFDKKFADLPKDATVFLWFLRENCPHCKGFWWNYRDGSDYMLKKYGAKKVIFLNAELSNNFDLAYRYKLKHLPTIITFKNGDFKHPYLIDEQKYFNTSEDAIAYFEKQYAAQQLP
jgi:thiol-disulfide isomerase/thioredoxin